jgi:hypothetical protein
MSAVREKLRTVRHCISGCLICCNQILVVIRNALLVQIYLRINQPDMAKHVLKQMKQKDEDSVLVTLANAWINLSPVKF